MVLSTASCISKQSLQLWKNMFKNICMRLWIAPSIRSRRAVSGRGLLLSVAYDLTCFMRYFDLYKLCLKRFKWQSNVFLWLCIILDTFVLWMRLWIVPWIRSRRAVSGCGLLLSVAYDLSCFMKVLDLVQTWSIFVQTWSKVLSFQDTFVNSMKKLCFATYIRKSADLSERRAC